MRHLLLLLLLAGSPLAAQPRDMETRASFLPKFARYVTWPTAARPAPRLPFQLCVIGRDPFGPVLDAAASGVAIDGHGVAIRRLTNAAEAGGCHLAFVQGPAPADTARMLRALGALPVLTVTDGDSGSERGMIHFTRIGGRVRFYADQAAAAERGLTISSRLLALAVAVRPRR